MEQPDGCCALSTLGLFQNFVSYERLDSRSPISPGKREAMLRLAERLRELERQEQQRRLITAPALSDAYHVTFSKGTNSTKLSP